METDLTTLQRAYLLGRSDYVPLGGVAMQEFREYRGRFDLTLLERRLVLLAERHPALRTVIDRKTFVREVRDTAAVDFVTMDFSAMTREEADARIAELRQEFAQQLFDLDGPPWRVVAFRLPPSGRPGEDTCAIFFRFDALILDGFSIAALLVELFEDRRPGGETSVTPAPKPDRPAVERDAAYWKDKLAGYGGAPRLPWKQPLETIRSSRYARRSLAVETGRFRTLSRVGAGKGLFRNTVLSAVVLEVLSFWLNEGDLHVGVPAAPRQGGAYSNESTFIALGWGGDGDTGLAARAEKLQADVLEGLDHMAFSGIDINRHLMDIGGGAEGVALPVVLTNGLSWPVLSPDHPVRLCGALTQTPQVAMDIRLSADPDGGLQIDIDYAEQALDGEMVDDILKTIDRAVTRICDTGALDFASRDVVDLAHYRFNTDEETWQPYGYLARIARHMFGEEDNDRTALIQGARRLSYAELGTGVARALAFLDQRGLGKGDVVVLALPRAPEQTMLVLACALRGIIWVPVDPCAPAERLKMMFDNCRPTFVFGTSPVEGYEVHAAEDAMAMSPAEDPSALMRSPDELSASRDAAYYLYTSGTTGKPKCVVLSNRSTDNVVGSTNAEWDIAAEDIFFQVSPLHHDMSVYEIFGALSAGATLVQPAQGEEKDALRWTQLVAEHGVTIWTSVPTIFEMLLSCRSGDELRSLRLINQGGDYLKPAVIAEMRRTNPATRLSSIGGPTETTIWSIWHRIRPEDTGAVPYGRPLPANRYFVLNDEGGHCPVGVVGRIHSSGVNTALGYLEDGALTQHDFITIADEAGAPVRAFRSGDRGRYGRDGLIRFDSRVAGYIKVRGVRISIPDVENELVKHPDVARVLLAALGDERQGQTELGVLYQPVAGRPLTDADLRAYARARVQESHVPSRFLRVDAIPLSANGKPDRRAARRLLEEGQPRPPERTGAPARAPEAAESRRVLEIYLDVVGSKAPAADATTDFISLGLLPSHLKPISARLNAEFGTDLLPRQLVRCRNADQVRQLVTPPAA